MAYSAARPDPRHDGSDVAFRRFAALIRRLLHSKFGFSGLLLSVVIVCLVIAAPLLTPYQPNTIDYHAMLAGPSIAHPFGTDDLGRDEFTRALYGGRLSLGVSFGAVALALAGGIPLGLVAGYLGGLTDEILMRVVDSLMALPALVLALTITAVLGPSLLNAMLAIAVVACPGFARLVRGQVLAVRYNDYVLAARSVGVSPTLVVLRHILPNVVNPVLVQAALGLGFAMITESSLSFIGLGAQPPTATWGAMVQVGFQYLSTAPWLALVPALMIFLSVLGFNMLGEGLRGAVSPTGHTLS